MQKSDKTYDSRIANFMAFLTSSSTFFYTTGVQTKGETDMATSDKLNNLKQRIGSDSASWGSLAILTIGIIVLLMLMVSYSHAATTNLYP